MIDWNIELMGQCFGTCRTLIESSYIDRDRGSQIRPSDIYGRLVCVSLFHQAWWGKYGGRKTRAPWALWDSFDFYGSRQRLFECKSTEKALFWITLQIYEEEGPLTPTVQTKSQVYRMYVRPHQDMGTNRPGDESFTTIQSLFPTQRLMDVVHGIIPDMSDRF